MVMPVSLIDRDWTIIFNGDIASYLQQIAVFFEVGGLSLLIIEIYLPNLSLRIEKLLDNKSKSVTIEEIYNNFVRKNAQLVSEEAKSIIEKYYVIFFPMYIYLMAFSAALFAEFISYIGVKIEGIKITYIEFIKMSSIILIASIITAKYISLLLFHISRIFINIMPFVLSIIFFFFLLMYIVFRRYLFSPINFFIAGLNRIANDKALGALGLLLAILGTLCEMCLNVGCYGFS
ncbi:MAG: hypothetical protein ACR2RF_14085 [Geminicoccaceae bacterium]